MITTLLFDLDGVVLNFLKAEEISLAKVFQDYGIPYGGKEEKLYHTINRHLWDEFEKGTVDKDRVTLGRFVDLFDALHIDADGIQAARQYQNGIAYCFEAYQDALDILPELAKKYRIYAVTNGVDFTAHNRLKGTDTAKYFLDVFVSESIGAQKPSLEYFNYVMDHIDYFDVNSTVLIGDSLTSDIQGAKNIGVTSIYLNRTAKENTSTIIPDHTISSLYELEPLLASLS